MARSKEQQPEPAPEPPVETGLKALVLASRLARPADWADGIVRRAQPLVMVDFGARLRERFGSSGGTSTLAAEVARRFERSDMGEQSVPLEIAPFSPPQRQISAARQGALEGPKTLSSDSPSLMDDLKKMGWL